MKGSLIIVSFFIIGTLCGVYHLIPYDFTDSKLSYYALCGLMFCVGISIGNDPNTLKSFRSLNPRLVFLPIMTILGTLAGCAIAGAFMSQRSPLDCMQLEPDLVITRSPAYLSPNIKVPNWELSHYFPISCVKLSLCCVHPY